MKKLNQLKYYSEELYEEKVKVVTVVIKSPEQKILIMKRGMTAPWMPGAWDLPGGNVDPGETPLEAAQREVQEETGMNIQVRPSILMRGGSVQVFVANSNQFEPKMTEHDEFVWIDIDELNNYNLVFRAKDAINRIR